MHTLGEKCASTQPVWKTDWGLLKKKVEMLYGPAIFLLCAQKKQSQDAGKIPLPPTFIMALFAIAKK